MHNKMNSKSLTKVLRRAMCVGDTAERGFVKVETSHKLDSDKLLIIGGLSLFTKPLKIF